MTHRQVAFQRRCEEVRKQAMWVTGGRKVQRMGTPHANALKQTPNWHGQGARGQCGRDKGKKGKSIREEEGQRGTGTQTFMGKMRNHLILTHM